LISGGLDGLLVAGAYRDADLDAAHPLTALLSRWQRLDPPPLQLRLDNLPADGLADLLAEMLRLPAQQASHLAAHVGTRTAGNPFDTIEMINALRHDGALVPGEDGWHWDEATIRRFVGQGDVVDLLAERLARMPREAQELIAQLGCLGGEVELGLLAVASALPVAELEARLAPALEDGLLVLAQSAEMQASSRVSFRHHRVQRAAHGQLDALARSLLHLTIARRFAAHGEFAVRAVEQYMYAVDVIDDLAERRRVVDLLHAAAVNARQKVNYVLAERLLTAALALMTPENQDIPAPDIALFTALKIELHATLYSLGRLEEADDVYASVKRRCHDPLGLVDVTCMQMGSLTNRARTQEAMALGLDLLRQLGLEIPQDIGAAIAERIGAVLDWVSTLDKSEDMTRMEVSDPRVLAVAKLLNETEPAALACNPALYAWLVLESQHQWVEHGPCPQLIASLCAITAQVIALRQDYRAAYAIAQHVRAVIEARGYETVRPIAGFVLAAYVNHWFDRLEDNIKQSQLAHEALLQMGNLLYACFTYYFELPAVFDCQPSLDACSDEFESALAFAARTGNDHAGALFLPYRQLPRTLRGETEAAGSFDSADFNEAAHLSSLDANPTAVAFYQITRALSAALFGDTPGLVRHASAAMPLLVNTPGFFITALAHLLQALSLAEQIKAAEPNQTNTLLADLDTCRDWLTARAADAPMNFLHLSQWIDAERAWATDDFRGAITGFDAALVEVAPRQRPWHRALMTERAGLCHLAQGMEHSGRMLLNEARHLYDAWGASAKVRQMTERFNFLREVPGLRRREDKAGGGISSDLIDMTAILTASQALSSETNLDRLKQSVSELLGSLTGATLVRVVVWRDDLQQWILLADEGDSIAVTDDAGTKELLPLSAFHYVERTLDTLLVDDAKRDDRFAADPYLSGLEYCSLMVVPILSQGKANAVLLLENHLGSGAFTMDRLDAVKLIAGQLAVSLDNALLYEKLEKRVAERTQQLRDTQSELVTTARQAGMAEIANNVLHNVGNVLNSVNISAGVVNSKMRESKAKGLAKAMQLMNEHATDLGDFLTRDEKGKVLPGYLNKLVAALTAEQQSIIEELGSLTKSIDHIKDIVSTQQSYAGAASIVEPVQVRDLMEDALRMNVGLLTRHDVEVIKEYADIPPLLLDKPRIMQIFVNLISNARQAMEGVSDRPHRITLGIDIAEREDGRRLLARIADNGVGVLPENLARIFSHGFTTRKDGHGFGLHSCVLAAKEMGGTLTLHSDGPGKGATFTLELPANTEGGVQ
jgi:signal transduction histidine kinase